MSPSFPLDPSLLSPSLPCHKSPPLLRAWMCPTTASLPSDSHVFPAPVPQYKPETGVTSVHSLSCSFWRALWISPTSSRLWELKRGDQFKAALEIIPLTPAPSGPTVPDLVPLQGRSLCAGGQPVHVGLLDLQNRGKGNGYWDSLLINQPWDPLLISPAMPATVSVARNAELYLFLCEEASSTFPF